MITDEYQIASPPQTASLATTNIAFFCLLNERGHSYYMPLAVIDHVFFIMGTNRHKKPAIHN